MAFLTGGINFIYGATPLIMIVIGKQLGASDVDIGLMFSIGGIGGVLGSLVGGRVQRRFSFGQVIAFVLTTFSRDVRHAPALHAERALASQ
jgi:predicted MFS family arabinose efflux permease